MDKTLLQIVKGEGKVIDGKYCIDSNGVCF
jgi:hypothetical protein